MEKMKAIVKQNESSDDFILIEIPIPKIDEDEVLVGIKAIGVGIQDGLGALEKVRTRRARGKSVIAIK